MRIGYFTNTYPRAVDTFIQREVTGLRDRGFEVFTYFSRSTGYNPKQYKRAGPVNELDKEKPRSLRKDEKKQR